MVVVRRRGLYSNRNIAVTTTKFWIKSAKTENPKGEYVNPAFQLFIVRLISRRSKEIQIIAHMILTRLFTVTRIFDLGSVQAYSCCANHHTVKTSSEALGLNIVSIA